MRKFFFFLFFVVLQFFAGAQPGSLDATFNPGTGANEAVYSMVQQPDGKIVIGGLFTLYNGTARTRIARLNADGSLDASFNPGSGASDYVLSMARQADGKILIAGFFTTYNGTARNRIARLNSDGSLDATFNPGSGANNVVYTVAVQPDGKILIGGIFTNYNGTARNRIARLNSDGSLDATFNPGSGAEQVVYPIVVQPDGKIIIGGKFTTYNGTARNCVARLNSDGSLDASFNPGSGANDYLYAMDLQPDGKILIGGVFTTFNGTGKNHIARLNADGSLDATFNSGSGTNEGVFYVIRQGDGKILIGGDFSSYNGIGRNLLARLNADGSLDPSFDPGAGPNNLGIYSMIQQSDGKILIGGVFTTYNGTNINRIARINNGATSTISTNANLSNLTLISGALNPVFAASSTSYTASVSNATSAITLTPTVAESNATVTVNNTPVTSGSASGSIPLAVGANTITVKVTAQDGVTTNTYTITVNRAAPPGVLLSSSPTIAFTNSTGFGDNIAEDGEGGSTAISDFNIQVMPINSSGAKLTASPLQYHSNADWIGYPSIITYGDTYEHYGWSIKSDNGAEFSLVSFSFLDWGDYSGNIYVAEAFRNGSSLGTISFTGNTNGTMVQLTNAAQLTSIFSNVDEMRVYRQGGIETWIALNNIRITTPSVSLPTVTSINTASPNPTAATSVSYTVSFSGSVTGVSISNFSLSGTASNASISAVSGSGTTWTVSVNTGSVDGTLNLSLANATGISPGIGTTLPYSGQQYIIDRTSPTLAITSNKSQLKAGETATITFTFSEDPAATFTNADIVVSGGTLGAITGSGTTRTAVFTPMANVNGGTASITVAAGSYSDAAGNNGGGGLSPVLSFDTQAPTVISITRADANPTAATSVSFTVSFSEAVTGLDASDFTITTTSGNAAGTVASVTGGGTTYTVTVDNITGAGGLRLDLNNSGTGITDTYGNAVSGGYTSGQSYTIGFGPATISFSALPVKTYGDADLAPGASSTNSGTPITYTSSNTSVATIVSGKIHIVGAGTTIITASQPAGNGYSAATDVQQTLTVNPATLTITANNQSKVYGSVNPAFTASYNGFVNGDNVSSLTTQPTFTTTATTSSSVGNYPITVSGAVSSKYIISYVAGNLAVTPAALTITANDQTKTYGAGVPALTASYSGFVNGDNASSLSTAPTLSTTATAASAAGDYTITASGAVASNYAISYATGILSVTPATLTITADDKTKVYGAAVPVLTASYSGFVNGDDASSLTTQPVLSTSATVSSGVGTYAITASGAVASNYTISYVSGTLTVSAAQPVITFGSLPVKTYGDTDFDAGATSDNASTPVIYSSDNTTVAAIVNGKVRVVGAGTANITASQASDANHTAATDVIRQLTVNKAAITIAADAKNKTYGENDPALTYQITSGALVGTDNFTGSLVRDAGEDAGNYVINQGTLGLNGNYALTYNSADLTINKAAITVTADARTKIYGQSDPALTYQISSGALVGTDTFTGSLTRDAGENAGSYAIRQGTLALNTNYILTYTGASLIVNQASLTITADDKTKVYGQNNPVFTASYSGLVNGDNASGLAVQPTFITTAATTSPVGNYIITASGADDPNYTISYIAGNLSITPAALTITADNKIKVYGEADPVLTYSVAGLVNSDDLTGSLVRTPGNNAGVYAIQQGSLSATNNYVLSYQGANFTITPKPVTVAADAQTKIYGQPDPAFTYSVSPVLLNGDVLNGALSRTAGEDAGSYAINQGSLNHPNYTLSFTGNALTINKAAQQITWNQTLVAGCDGSTTIALTATASSGLPISYQSGNPGIATITNNQLVITGTGTTTITASQAGNNNYLPAADVQQELLSKLPAHLLVKRWDDVLVFDNSSNQFTAWQWYKNGVAINGATGQYYYENGKLNGDYYAVVKTAAGVTMQTCAISITAGATFIPISIFPNPVAPGQTITVKTGYSAAQLQGATIVVTNMLGAVVQTVQNVAPQTTITMPFAEGLYVIRLKLANGVTASVNALVKP